MSIFSFSVLAFALASCPLVYLRADILETEHSDERRMRLDREELREPVGCHVSSWHPLDMDRAVLDLLAEPVLMDIDMSKLRPL